METSSNANDKTLSIETSSTSPSKRHSELTSGSNLPSPRYRKNAPISEIRDALMAYGMKEGAQKELVQEKTENVLK